MRWEPLTIEGHHLRRLAGLDYPIFTFALSLDGRRLLVAFEIGQNARRGAMAVIDIQGEAHWWLNTRAFFYSSYLAFYPYPYPSHFAPYLRWLPDGRLLWIDQACHVFLWDGQDRRDLAAPVPMVEVEYAGNGIAFARSIVQGGSLWRVDLASGAWETVTTDRPAEVATLDDFLLAQDSSYALGFGGGQQWRVPAQTGTVAEPLPEVEVGDIPGHGGPSGPPSTQLAGSPYWLLNMGVALVVNEREGRIVTARDLQLPEGYNILDYYASPDGRWLAAIVNDDPQQPWEQTDIYLTPSTDLTAGRVVEGVSVAGWHTDAPAVIFRDDATGTLSVARLPLADVTPGVALTGATPPLVTLPGRLFAVDAGSPARLLEFDLDGNLLDALDLSAHYDSIDFGAGAIDRLFLSVTQRQTGGAIKHALVEWVVGLKLRDKPESDT